MHEHPRHRASARAAISAIAAICGCAESPTRDATRPAPSAAVAKSRVAFREWDARGGPQDPAVGPDGALWYTAEKGNVLGRLDPSTGQIREFVLSTPDSGPHGLVVDRDGAIWFTAHAKGYIGKLRVDGGEITEFAMPEARAKDPHTPVVGADGKLYFTLQQSNLIGRLDPDGGAIELATVPTPHAQPYGIIATADALYFCEFGTNKLGRLEPHSMQVREIALRDPDARPRRLASASDGTIYYTDFARGFLGRLDPQTNTVSEWASPGGTTSQPYAIATTADRIVWYVETGVTPNMLVRFDPATTGFERYPIPSGGGVVRNMVATPDGKLFLAESGVDKVAVVTTR
jgi:virginiamycin B lyase